MEVGWLFPRERPSDWSSDKWATPIQLVRALEQEFGTFDLDPCCEPHTAKASTFYTEDGLSKPWFGRVFLNPPYSKPRPWLDRAIQAQRDGCLIVALLPVKTDTRWFHEAVLGKAEIRFIRGRVRWIGWAGTPIPSPKEPSMLAIYHPKTVAPEAEGRTTERKAFRAGYAAHPGDLGGWAFDLEGNAAGDREPEAWEAWQRDRAKESQ